MELRLLRTAVAIAMVTATFVHTDAGSAVAESHDRPAYRVDELASLGGLASAGASINDRGWVAGSSDLPGDASARATLWRDGTLTDLRTLGGPNSAVAWPVKNDRIVVGVSETATIGREGEDWSCSSFFPGEPTHHDCVGFVWRDGWIDVVQSVRAFVLLAGGKLRAELLAERQALVERIERAGQAIAPRAIPPPA